MQQSTKTKRFFTGSGVLLLILVLGYGGINPWLLRWGATHEEAAREMPGDLDTIGWTRAITMDATPEQIWPWLVQWGQGRGGWYSYDWLENLFGFDIHTAQQILPEYQDLAIGDPICIARGFCTSHVTVLEPNRWLSWQAKDDRENPVWTFTFGLFPVNETQTRLVIRESFRSDVVPPAAVFALEIPDVVMEQKALHTVKERAEGITSSVLVTALEISVWFVALIVCLAAFVSFVRGGGWNLLELGALAVVVILMLTFLFPPLWLRLLLDLGLLAGLISMARGPVHFSWLQRAPENRSLA
jgi:hypothetical protein